MLKAVILVGGPFKGTRFRPLSFEVAKPLFSVAGLPLIQHNIEACLDVPNLKEILILGYYPASDFVSFINEMVEKYKINIRYLQEFLPLGTGGGMYHFRDQIRMGNPDKFFVLNGDVCMEFPLQELLKVHQRHKEALATILVTEAARSQSLYYGCVIQDKETEEVTHYVEKPETFVSPLINCGVYMFSMEIFQKMGEVFNKRHADCNSEVTNETLSSRSSLINLEMEILLPMAGTGKLFAYQTNNWWSQVKTPGSAIYANRQYLALYRKKSSKKLLDGTKNGCTTIGDVYIHPSATIDPTAVLGPNVSVGKDVVIEQGVRVRESIILSGACLQAHSVVLYSILGRSTLVGKWSRIEGTPSDPNPEKPFAKVDNPPLFNSDGRLNPSITVVACCVTISPEVILLNSIVLPQKVLSRSYKNEIIL